MLGIFFRKRLFTVPALLLPLFLTSIPLGATVPGIIRYQGRISVNDVNFDDIGFYKFSLVDATGTVTYWSHNGTGAGGEEPSGNPVLLNIRKGLFSVGLGDTGVTNMTEPIPPEVFNNEAVFLRIWFDDGLQGFQQLQPDQRITTAAYAMLAAEIADGKVTTEKIAPGAITAEKFAPGALSVSSLNATDGTGAQTVAVADNGNVGVNLAEPLAAFHVAGGLRVFNPPVIVSEIFDGDGEFNRLRGATALAVVNSTAYIVSEFDNSLSIININNALDPQLLSEVVDGSGGFIHLSRANSVFVSGNTAYVTSLTDDALSIIDVTNKINPVLRSEAVRGSGAFTKLDGPNDVFVQGNTAFVTSHFDDAVTIINVTNSNNPQLLAEISNDDGEFARLDGVNSIFVADTFAYVTAFFDNALTIIDISDPSDPQMLAEIYDEDGQFTRLFRPTSVYVTNFTAYVTSEADDALTIIDVSDPFNPALISEIYDEDGQFSKLDGASSVTVSGDNAFVAAKSDDALTIIDITDPANPLLRTEVFDEDGNANRLRGARTVVAASTYIYVVANGDDAMTTLDLTDSLSTLGLAVEERVGIGTTNVDADLVIGNNTDNRDRTLKIICNDADASIRLVADALNGGGESFNPYVLFAQDGSTSQAMIGLVGDSGRDPQENTYASTRGDALFLGTLGSNALQLGTDFQTHFTLDATGNIGIGRNNPSHPIHMSSGAHVSTGGTWTNASDRALKENLQPVNERKILEKVAALPIQSWNYKAEARAVRHIGPTAQDFRAAFELGGSDKAIGTVDADGVALAAIKGLFDLLEEKDHRIEDVKAANDRLSRELQALREQLQALQEKLD